MPVSRLALVVACVAVLAGPMAQGIGPVSAPCPAAPCFLWASGDADVESGASSVFLATSPDGTRVYTGGVAPVSGGQMPHFIAHRASDGAVLWHQHVTVPSATTASLADGWLSPDGSVVYGVGFASVPGSSNQAVVVALRTSDGAVLWTHARGGLGSDLATSGVSSADGTRVFVGARMAGPSGLRDAVVFALNAATGAAVWTRTYDGGFEDGLAELVLSPDGAVVFGVGTRGGATGTADDILTLAVATAEGVLLWAHVFDGLSHHIDFGREIAVAPDGTRVYALGTTRTVVTIPTVGTLANQDLQVVALDAATGTLAWERHLFTAALGGSETAGDIVVDPLGARVYVGGSGSLLEPGLASPADTDGLVFALDSVAGAVLWSLAWDGAAGGSDTFVDLDIGPDPTILLASGMTTNADGGRDILAAAIDTATGAARWTVEEDRDGALDLAFAGKFDAGGRRIFVTGGSQPSPTIAGSITLGYALFDVPITLT